MDPVAASPGRSITIDRARKRRIRRDDVLHTIGAPDGLRRLAVSGLAGCVLGLAVRSWPAAVVGAVLAVLGRIAWWWLRTNASMREGLDVGQTVTVEYAASGGISVTDSTGQLWMGRGWAIRVERFRSLVIVAARDMAFMLPRELLTDEDVAFLVGRDIGLEAASAHGPELPLSREITPDDQRTLVSAATSIVLRSADFLVPWVLAPFMIGLFVAVGSAPAIIGMCVFCAVCAVPGLRGLRRTRSRLRSTYPVGLVLRAGVTTERLWLSLANGTLAVPWHEFVQSRLSDHAVLLRKPRRRFGNHATLILPRALFDDEALTTISSVVPCPF